METICYEVFPTQYNLEQMRRILVKGRGFSEKQNAYGTYFYSEVPSVETSKLNRILNHHRYKYRYYDRRYQRSDDYRQRFFATHKRPYHCAYCGRRLKPNQIEVDHLIPVAKAKSKPGARALLRVLGMKSVNDARNLVSACKRCNRRKSDSMGFWVVRGAVGRFRLFWIIWRLMLFILITLIVLSIVQYTTPLF